jgi:hypothetical protein
MGAAVVRLAGLSSGRRSKRPALPEKVKRTALAE